MKDGTLNIAVIQANLVWENPVVNRKLFTQKIKRLSQNTDLVILPELFTTGFTMHVDLAETITGKTVVWMQNLTQQHQIAIVGSIIIKENNNFYNRLLFVHPNGEIEHYNKCHLFTLSGEDKVFTPGNKLLVVEYKGWKICPLICYDLRFPTWSNNIHKYDLLLYVASWPKKRINAWDTLLKARAIENMSYTIGVNRVGQDGNGFEYSGNSVVLDTLGNIIADFKPNTEGVQIVALEKQKQDNLRASLGFLKDINRGAIPK